MGLKIICKCRSAHGRNSLRRFGRAFVNYCADYSESVYRIDFIHGEMLFNELGGEESGTTKVFRADMGHVAPIEMRKEFNQIIADAIEKTERMAKDSS